MLSLTQRERQMAITKSKSKLKVRSQNFIFSETTGEAARAHGAEAYADR